MSKSSSAAILQQEPTMLAQLRLKVLGGGNGLTTHQRKRLSAVEQKVPRLGADAPAPDTIVLLAGWVKTVQELRTVIEDMLTAGQHPAVIADCIAGPSESELNDYLISLHEEHVQIEKALYWAKLASAERHHVSLYSPWELSVALLVLLVRGGDWMRSPEILVVERNRGKPGICTPCGFVSKGETLEQSASRKGYREAGVQTNPAHLQILHEDSSPKRDEFTFAPHIIFLNLAYCGEEKDWDRTIGHHNSKGETSAAWFMPASEFIALPYERMAFEELRLAAKIAMMECQKEKLWWQVLNSMGLKPQTNLLPSKHALALGFDQLKGGLGKA